MMNRRLRTGWLAVACVLAAGGERLARAAADPNIDAAPGMVVKNDAPGWMWYGMVPYENALLPDGAAHAGGPGTYAMYTFQGSGVDVYGMRSLTVVADKRTHRTGKVKVSIDDAPQATIDVGSSTIDYHAKIFSVTGLSGGNHVIQITPVDGWAVVDSLTLTAGGAESETTFSASAVDLIGKKHLVGYWSCEDGQGATLADKSGHGHTGQFQAGASWSSDSKVGKGAVSFPQPGGVEIPGPVIDTTKSFTVAAWVKLSSAKGAVSGYETFVSMDGEQQSGFFLQSRGTPGPFAFTMHPFRAEATTTPVLDRWYHVAGVYDAPTNTLAVFVNGALEAKTQIPPPAHANGNTVIGRAKFSGSYTDFFAGDVDDVRMYDIALLPGDIAAIYGAGM